MIVVDRGLDVLGCILFHRVIHRLSSSVLELRGLQLYHIDSGYDLPNTLARVRRSRTRSYRRASPVHPRDGYSLELKRSRDRRM